MTDTMTDTTVVGVEAVGSPPIMDVEVARQLMERARSEGVRLVGPGGLLLRTIRPIW